jgi:pimeloyl-ACP methyl ester carboxylesterase
MQGRSIARRFAVFILSVALIFAPVDVAVFLHHPSALAEDYIIVEGDQSWTGTKTLSGYASVEPGATLTIEKGSVVELEGGTLFSISGTLRIKGTPEEPVIFRKKSGGSDEGYSVSVQDDGKVRARNMDVSGGGSVMNAYLVRNDRKPSFVRYALADTFYTGAFEARSGGSLDIEGASFHDNALALYADRSSGNEVKVWRSKFSGNDSDFVNDASVSADMRYDFWGSANGPEKECEHCGPYERPIYTKLVGNADFSDWATTEYFRDPVIIVPGILGSWEKDGKLMLDPILHTYDDLSKGLQKNGYFADSRLFALPYDWRDSNVETARLLKAKIEEIKKKEHWPKVDIVAHSMGGLVAREYIEGDDYRDDIDQLITLGTPHNGAPEGYVMWEGGEATGFKGMLLEWFLHQEVEEGGYGSLFEYVRKRPVASVQELLPVYDYLYDIDRELALRKYPDQYPRNTFLENLNVPEKIERLKAVAFEKVVGNVDSDKSTPVGFEVIGADMGEKWKDGYPLGFEFPLIREKHIRSGFGDGTVPLESARSENIPSDASVELNAAHLDLPTASQEAVMTFLTGKPPVEVYKEGTVDDLLAFEVFSPIDIQIVSPSGKRVGKNFTTGGTYDEIQGAYYTGFDVQSEFVTIPNPEKGDYKILTQGTGAGSYRIEVAHIRSDASGDATESVAMFRGDTTPGATGSFSATLTDTDIRETPQILTIAETSAISGSAGISADNGNDDSGGSHREKKKSTKKPTIVTATANEVRPLLATSLFPYPDMETAPASKSNASAQEKAGTDSEVAGALSESGNHPGAIILAVVAIVLVVCGVSFFKRWRKTT